MSLTPGALIEKSFDGIEFSARADLKGGVGVRPVHRNIWRSPMLIARAAHAFSHWHATEIAPKVEGVVNPTMVAYKVLK